MGLIDKFRKSQETTDRKVERINKAVKDVLSSDATMLSLVSHAGSVDVNLENLVASMTQRIADSVCNPVNDFLDISRSKGLSDETIKDFVINMNIMFGLTDSTTYDDQLSAVATYFAKNPRTYDDLALFR